MRARKDAAGRYVMTELTDWASDDPDCFSGKLVMDLVATKDGYLLVGTLSEGCLVFEVERRKEFAPIKNKTGVDSVESAKELCRKNGIQL